MPTTYPIVKSEEGPPVEHVVFYPGPDGNEAFRRTPTLEDAVRFVEHLRNVAGVDSFSVHALNEVPLSFRAYYRVEVPGTPVEPVPAAPVVEAPPVLAVEVPPVDVPNVEVPAVEVPSLEVPAVEVPSLELPSVEAPVAAEVPNLEPPSLDVPVLAEVPVLADVPSVEDSAAEVPEQSPDEPAAAEAPADLTAELAALVPPARDGSPEELQPTPDAELNGHHVEGPRGLGFFAN